MKARTKELANDKIKKLKKTLWPNLTTCLRTANSTASYENKFNLSDAKTRFEEVQLPPMLLPPLHKPVLDQ